MTGKEGFALICLPGAGRSRTVFRSWPRYLPSEVELIPLELPTYGYDDRSSVGARATEMVRRLRADGQLRQDRDVGVFGHSFGALVAYEMVRAIGDISPHRLQLFAAAAPAAHRVRPSERPDGLDDQALIDRLLALGDVNASMFDPEVRAAFLPKIRADYQLAARYSAEPGPPLLTPVTTFGAVDDPSVSREDLAAWSEITSADVDCHLLDGGHFFVDGEAELVCRLITEAMCRPRGI